MSEGQDKTASIADDFFKDLAETINENPQEVEDTIFSLTVLESFHPEHTKIYKLYLLAGVACSLNFGKSAIDGLLAADGALLGHRSVKNIGSLASLFRPIQSTEKIYEYATKHSENGLIPRALIFIQEEEEALKKYFLEVDTNIYEI